MEATDKLVQDITDNANSLGMKIIDAANELNASEPSVIYACMTVALFIIKHSVEKGIINKKKALPMAANAFNSFLFEDLKEFIENYEKQQENG